MQVKSNFLSFRSIRCIVVKFCIPCSAQYILYTNKLSGSDNLYTARYYYIGDKPERETVQDRGQLSSPVARGREFKIIIITVQFSAQLRGLA